MNCDRHLAASLASRRHTTPPPAGSTAPPVATAGLATDGSTAAWTAHRPLTALLASLHGYPNRPVAADVDADATLATLRCRQRGDDRLLRSLKGGELEERACLGADDLDFLDRTKASGQGIRESRRGDRLEDTLEETCISIVLDKVGENYVHTLTKH